MNPPASQPVPQPLRPHVVPTGDQIHRERFEAHELAIVLSHYDLGIIEQLRAYPRGSRRSPKVRLKTRSGEYLLKRRAPGQDDPYRVAFAHDLQLSLEEKGYPVPGIVGTRDENNSMLQLNGRAYELFHFIHGTRFDRTPAQALMIGEALGRFHRLLAGHRSAYEPKVGSFHAASDIDGMLALIAPSVNAANPHTDKLAMNQTVDFLRRAYHDAAERVNQAGYRSWQRIILHGDWHPGNLLFHDGRIAAVLDFDSSRLEPRAVDVANAALQFSMLIGTPDQPQTWPDGCEPTLMMAVIRGYDQASGRPLSAQERAAVPWLMIEALIIESVVPIAATGSFARIPGAAFLQMVERKVKWIRPRAARLVEAAEKV